MSHPIKRFSIALDNPWFGNGAYVSEDGHYVLHSDYAALAAENERLKKEKHEMTFQINIDDALAAENERLVNLVAYLKQDKPFTKHEDDIRRGLRTK